MVKDLRALAGIEKLAIRVGHRGTTAVRHRLRPAAAEQSMALLALPESVPAAVEIPGL